MQKVGCSTPERPTHKFIEGHLKGFMGDDDEIPLQPIQVLAGKKTVVDGWLMDG